MSDDLVKKKKLDDGDLDITPMIDVTFLLLIFFMVASTMEPSSEAKLAPAKYGDGVTADTMMQIAVLAPIGEGSPPTIKIDGRETTMEELSAYVGENYERTAGQVLMRVDRDVPNGYLNEIFGAIKEGTELELQFFHAVEEK